MNKYRELLSTIAQQYHIGRGDNEKETDWKARVIYSICGMMAYASLFDDGDIKNTVSILHLKERVRQILDDYKALYPESAGKLSDKPETFEKEIESLFLDTGMAYHMPDRIAPSMKHEARFHTILFQRGIAIDEITSVSGCGFYSVQQHAAPSEDNHAICSMFCLEQEHLLSVWQQAVAAASWKLLPSLDGSNEYLRLQPPFSSGYWKSTPDTTGDVSLLRMGRKGAQIYYLYRYTGAGIEVSPLPGWQVKDGQYRSLACACLASLGTLPPISYQQDGTLVHLQQNYLFPPRELAFLRLYSWPEECAAFSQFKRKLSLEVFVAMKQLLSERGYTFSQGGIVSNAKWSKLLP